MIPSKADEVNINLQDLADNSSPVNYSYNVSMASSDSVSEIETRCFRNLDGMNENSPNLSPINYSSKIISSTEQQESTSVQLINNRPTKDLEEAPVPCPVRSPIKSSMEDTALVSTSTVCSPPYSSAITTTQILQNGTEFLDSGLQKVENDILDKKLEYKNEIDYKKNHKKKFKHKKHKSRKGHANVNPYRNLRQAKEEDKLMKKLRGNGSVIKENTTLLNTNHSPLYPIRSVQDLEMKLSNIRQRLPNDTLLYKCASRDSSPTNFEDQPSKVEEISGSSICQNENELPQNPYHFNSDIAISVVNNHCASKESTNSCIPENLKLGKHVFTHKNADLPMKKRKQDLSLYNCIEEPVAIQDEEQFHHSINCSEDKLCNSKTKSKFNQLKKKFKRPKRRFSFTEDSKTMINKSVAGNNINKEQRRSKSLIDWYDDEKICLDSPNAIQPLSGSYPQKVPCLLYTSPSPRDRTRSRMPSSA